jgi:hypothetical protein
VTCTNHKEDKHEVIKKSGREGMERREKEEEEEEEEEEEGSHEDKWPSGVLGLAIVIR